MVTLDPISKPYHIRANIPFGANNTTAAIIKAYGLWSLYAFLTNQLSIGTTGTHARHANSVWTVVGSSNGSVANASDNWTSTFNISNLVAAGTGVAHSWIHLRNPNAGYDGLDLIIDMNSATTTSAQITACRLSGGVTGGTTTTRAQSPR